MTTETLSASGDGSIDPSGTQHFDYTVETGRGRGRRVTVYVEGDAEATDVTIEFLVAPADADTDFHALTAFDTAAGATSFNTLQDANVDLTAEADNRRAYDLNLVTGAGALRVSITNNATAGVVDPTVKVDEYDP